MKHQEGVFRGTDGLRLFCQSWLPDGEPRAIMAIVHGVGEHSGRYGNLINPLVADGYGVFSYDQRGHGRSPGQRVYIDHWGEFREDLKAFVDLVGKSQSGKPVFLFGHSMGALVVLDYLVQYPRSVKGGILCGAPFEPGGVAKPYLVVLARVLSGIWPRFSANLGLDLTALSRDPQVQKDYEADPLCCRQATVRWGTESLDTVTRVKAHAADISSPLLLIHGEADRLSLATGTRAFYERLALEDKTQLIYPGGFHEPHNDIQHQQVAADIRQWLEQHL